MIFWAIAGAFIGLTVVLITYYIKNQRYKKIMGSIKEPVEYSALYHYANFKRYKKGAKFFDSYGVLYLVGNTLNFKTVEGVAPLSFDLTQCSVEMEPDWRWLKWFSVTTPAGEKHYFNSHKMGAFKNDSSETLNGYAAAKAKSRG